MEINNVLATFIALLLLGVGIFAGMAFSGGTEIVNVPGETIIKEKLVQVECPVVQTPVCPEVVIPEIENARAMLGIPSGVK